MTARQQTALKLLALAGRVKSTEELRFLMLNRSLLAIPYDRASLWRTGDRPRLVGVSGIERADPNGEFARSWLKLIAAFGPGSDPRHLTAASGEAVATELEAIGPGTTALWLPLPGTDLALAVERRRGGFGAVDLAVFTDLATGYGTAWRALAGGRPDKRRRWAIGLGAAALALAALVLVRLPLRIVAPCEVVARKPFLVATPMEGVIREVLVEPGQTVDAGTVLAVYEEEIQEGDLEVARRQVEAAEAELAALGVRSLTEPALRERAQVMRARLEQERARLGLAEERWRKMRVTAPLAGSVQFEDPDAWRGRPVAVGEKLLWLVEPGDNEVRVWLPQSDRIELDYERPVRVFLDAYGGRVFRSRLRRVGTLAMMSPSGVHAFPAHAEWMDGEQYPDGLLGLTGTAILYGPDAPLWWWLARKPVGSIRKWLGL